MRFLCFHGGSGNGENFKKVLWHLRQNLEADNTASFYFVDGLFPTPPVKGIQYECPPPNLNFFDMGDNPIDISVEFLTEKLAFMKTGSPEDAMRKVYTTFGHADDDSVILTVEYIRNILEEDGPFDGVIGTSQGACAAATALVDSLETSRKTARPNPMKCGIFFIGLPPLNPNGKGCLLGDEWDHKISTPTCHVFSESDPIVALAKALYNICEPSSRRLVLHDGGHIIPHESELMAEVAQFVRDVKHGRV